MIATDPIPIEPSTAKQHQHSYTTEFVKKAFNCISQDQSNVDLCCQYLNGTAQQFIYDEFVAIINDSAVEPTSPSDNIRRGSVKRRKNCKNNNKLDSNHQCKGEVDSEDSVHVFPTVNSTENDLVHESNSSLSSPSSSPTYVSTKKPIQNSQHQFESLLNTLSIHLTSLQDQVDNVSSLLPSTTSNLLPKFDDGFPDNSANKHATKEKDCILSELHQVFRHLNKVKRLLTLKNERRRPTSNHENSRIEASTTSSSSPTSPSSPNSYNSNIGRLLSNRMVMLQLLHLECCIIVYLQKLETVHNCPVENFLSSLEYATLRLRLDDICRTYYSLLNKLSYESSFLKLVSLVHQNSAASGTRLLMYVFRTLARQEKLNSKHDNDGNDDNKSFENYHDEDILKVENDLQDQTHNVTMVNEEKILKTKESLNEPILANSRTIVIILTYLENLAKYGIFASSAISDSSKQNNLNNGNTNIFDIVDLMPKNSIQMLDKTFLHSNSNVFTLVSVCVEILNQFVDEKRKMNYPTKSLVRQHAIESLAHLCLSKNGLQDSIKLGSTLIRTILNLLLRSCELHSKMVKNGSFLLDSNTPTKRFEKLDLSHHKLYLGILRDIYGLLSILASITEFKSGREYLLFHNVNIELYEKFLYPFVETLNGTEESDPSYLNESVISDIGRQHVEDRGIAYRQLRLFLTTNQKMQRYLDRIVGLSNIIIQRLLDPMVMPLDNMKNPFIFDLPLQSDSNSENVSNNLVQPNNDEKVDQQEQEEEEDEQYVQFNSDLDDDDDDVDDENSDDEDSIVQQDQLNDSSNIETGNNFSNLEQYLKFFPEIDKNIKNSTPILGCQCDKTNFISRKEAEVEQPILTSIPPAPQFEWSKVYRLESNSVLSVMPRSSSSLPHPELNFVNQISNFNEQAQLMTYPFLDNVIRRKNFHHIKVVDHIRERLNCRPSYKLVYDIEDSSTCTKFEDGTLQFDSRFESANLRKVLRKENENEYLMMLNSDVNTSIHTQWFYFAIRGMKLNCRYRFKIINMQKKSILYNSGQQPLFYSARQFEQTGAMWQRIGQNDDQVMVAYYRNHYVRNRSISAIFTEKPCYTLEFTFTFPYEDDVCYLAYNMPFSYTFMKTNIRYWSHLVQHHNQHCSNSETILFEEQTLCHTLRGNKLPVLTITSSQHDASIPHYILLSARVHPSESNSSWILKGFIDFLLTPTNDSTNEPLRRRLLQKFIFKIVPMLNPDGVINGCTRTDLQRDDLNRQWHDPNPNLHPTIYHSRMLLKCLNEYSNGTNPVAFIDLHGHSRRKNIFSYSCSPLMSWKRADRQLYYRQSSSQHFCACNPKNQNCMLKCQLRELKELNENGSITDQENGYYLMPPFVTLPILLHLQRSPCFNLENCSFLVQKDREHTARVVGWREFNISLSYTIECSASGCDIGPYAGHHLSREHMEEMGRYIATSFAYLEFLYCSNRHVPLIVMPKSIPASLITVQQTTSPIRHPGNDDYLKNLLIKCTKRGKRTSNEQNRSAMRKLIQMYPDLNMLSASIVSSPSSSSLSSNSGVNSNISTPNKSNTNDQTLL